MRSGRVETATIVFTDLVGSTALRSELGDRHADQLLEQHDTLVIDGITAFGGRVVKHLGDGFMAVFSSSSDAVQAAVTVQQSFHRRNAGADTALYVRVGLAAGDVQHEEGDCFGMPVVQAARLCDRCDSGEIQATTIVKLLAGSRSDATFVDLGSLELKGISEPTDCVLIEWPHEDHTTESAPLQGFLEGVLRGELRGRASELATLREMWHLALAGDPQIVLVSGEAGLGKTRLVTQFALELLEDGAVVLAGRIEEGLGGPYQPFVEALMHHVRHAEPDQLDLGASAGELTRIAPDLERIVGELPEPIRADSGAEQYRLAAALTSWVRAVAAASPVLLIVDDFHWAEPQTAVLLRHLCTELAHSRVLVAVTYRDTDIPENPEAAGIISDLFRLHGSRHLDLDGLSADAVRDLLTDAGVSNADARLPTRICEHTDGNAFFIHEIIAGFVDAGIDDPDAGLPLPEGVTEVVQRRLGRLSPDAAAVLNFAAVIGREFSVKLLMEVVGDRYPIFDSLEDAIIANILEERGAGQHRFVHQIVVDTLLTNISATRRARLHLEIAAAIERTNATNLQGVLGELAHHYLAAIPLGELDRTARFAIRAGHKAVGQLAFHEAVEYFERARELANELPDDEQIDLLIAIAGAESHAGLDPSGARRDAAELAMRIGDRERYARVAVATEVPILGIFGAVDTGHTDLLETAIADSDGLPTALQARLYGALAAELVFSTDPARKEQLANRALELARQAGDPATLARVLALRYPTLWNARTLNERLDIVSELDHLAQDLDDVFLRFLATGNGALAMMEAARTDEAEERLDLLDELAEEIGEPRLRWFAAVARAKRQIMRGELGAAEATVVEGLGLGQLAGRADALSYFAAQSFCIGFHRRDVGGLEEMINGAVERNPGAPAFRSLRAVLYAELEDHDACAADLRDLAATGFVFPADFTELVALCFCAHATTVIGDQEIATTLYPVLERHRDRFADAGSTWYGAANHYLGGLAFALGRHSEAIELLGAGREQHRLVGSGPMVERSQELLDRVIGSG